MENKYLGENMHRKTFSLLESLKIFSLLFKEAVFTEVMYSLNIRVKNSVRRPNCCHKHK